MICFELVSDSGWGASGTNQLSVEASAAVCRAAALDALSALMPAFPPYSIRLSHLMFALVFAGPVTPPLCLLPEAHASCSPPRCATS